MRLNVVTLFSVFIGLISPNVFAAINSDLVSAISGCSSISKDDQRLACFDKLAQSSVTLLSTTTVINQSVSKTEQVISKETKKVDDFSKQHLKKTQEEMGPDSISATISELNKLIRGQWVVYLENGQEWQQKDDRKIKLIVGDRVLLKKGSMGAVYLYKEGSNRNIRVKRLK